MKGQPLMKHSRDLIGCIVQVYKTDWKRPDLPRPGIVTGFHPDAGLFVVTIFHDYLLDIRGSRSTPFGYLPNCLLVDDDDDMPVGVTEYARIKARVEPSAVARLAADMVIRRGDVDKPELVVGTEEGIKSIPDHDEPQEPDPQAQPQEPEPQEPDEGEKGNDAEEQIRKDQDQGDQQKRPAGDSPAEILRNSDEFQLVNLIDGITSVTVGPREIAIERDGEDKPLARLSYIDRKDPPNMPTTVPFGWKVKLRDPSGRCSRELEKDIQTRDKMKSVIEALHSCLVLAMDAEPNDFGSASENMIAGVNAYKSES